MGRRIEFLQGVIEFLGIGMGINLRSSDTRMTQEGLNIEDADVLTMPEGRAGVAQFVRADVFGKTDSGALFFNAVPGGPRGKAMTGIVEE